MSKQWNVVGISGTTCSGKSTLAQNLISEFPGSIFICQDEYFLPVDSPLHTWIRELEHINWEIMSALDMDKMHTDVNYILSQSPVSVSLPDKAKRNQPDTSYPDKANSVCFNNLLIIEGFLLFNDPVLHSLCDLCYYLTLTKEQCWSRRRVRVYDPPDVPGYFEKIVWPEHVKQRNDVLAFDDVKVIDAMNPIGKTKDIVVLDIKKTFNLC